MVLPVRRWITCTFTSFPVGTEMFLTLAEESGGCSPRRLTTGVGQKSMSEPMVLGGKLLSLLEEANITATYKPALLMSIIDCATETGETESIPVRHLAERVTELYWPQTVAYPTTGTVLTQNQGSQAKAIQAIMDYREKVGVNARTINDRLRRGRDWERMIRKVELTLAEMPIPRLQIPYEPFLYTFEWPWANKGGWRTRTYDQTAREIRLFPGVAQSLISLGPLLRPFIMRWWSEKAATMNPNVDEATSMLNFEQFMFGRDRVALDRIAEGLLDIQAGRCFYCEASIGKRREIDHFVPWSQSGDDGLFNLVAACPKCNNSKRSILAGPDFLESMVQRNNGWTSDLNALSSERSWPADRIRSARITCAAYLNSPGERPLWLGRDSDPETGSLQLFSNQISTLVSRLQQ